jgi:type III restriction enzyme
VSEVGDALRVLDITKPSVRQAIREAPDAKSVYESSAAKDY